MPKERIDGCHPFNGNDDRARLVAEVSWGRDTGHCQLVTKVIDRYSGDPYTPDDDRVLGAIESVSPRAALTVAEMTAALAGPRFTDGMYVDLDRRGINDLIRVLRRARDAAFGKDE